MNAAIEELRDFRFGRSLGHERTEASEHEEDDPRADGKKGAELHHRLDRDGQHEPALMLGGIGMPRAETGWRRPPVRARSKGP